MAITLLYQGNTPLHLAMESAHAESAALLIEAGADRTRVCPIHLLVLSLLGILLDIHLPQANTEDQTAEELEGVGGQEQKRAREYLIERFGKP